MVFPRVPRLRLPGVMPKLDLVKFKGMNKKMFNLHLKECEFRFNNCKQNLYKVLLGMFRKEPLKLS
jgi:transposase-like protein